MGKQIRDFRSSELAWFDVKNYSVLLEISVSDFISQVVVRCDLMDNIRIINSPDTNRELYGEHCWHHMSQSIDKKINLIKSGKAILPDPHEVRQSKLHQNNKSEAVRLNILPSERQIRAVSYTDLKFLHIHALYDKGIDFSDHKNHNIIVDSETVFVGLGSVLAKITLSDATDEEIISSLRKLLPKWRESLRCCEPVRHEWRVGDSTICMLIRDQILPCLDLMAWSEHNNIQITNNVLSRILFPDLARDSNHVAQTIKPNIEKVRARDFHIKIAKYLAENPDVVSRKVNQQLEIHRILAK